MDSTTPDSGHPSGQQVAADDMLPPVEAPDGRFLLQLFVVPAVIVFCVVMLWLLVTTLATRGQADPAEIVGALRGSNQARWQKAEQLASMLRAPQRYPDLKTNAALASQLAVLLEEEIEAAGENDNAIELRYYLCRVLGEFRVDDGLPVLLRAAREDVEVDVRREAVNAIAVLAQSFAEMDPPQVLTADSFVETFQELANDQDDLIRSQTAYALGVLTQHEEADSELKNELTVLLSDLHPDTRYNAALAFARSGDVRASGALSEMLDPEGLALTLKSEELESARSLKRDMVLQNAILGAKSLFDQNPPEAVADLRGSLEAFVQAAPGWTEPSPVPDGLIDLAERILAGQP
ncbi:MAG: HEAT repeat domain-containing protein [Planctomycetota bacterium]